MSTAIVWFRQDLRLSDNPALYHAAKTGHRLILVYIHSPQDHGNWPPGAASQWWLHHSLISLQSQVDKLGGRLIIRQGDSHKELLKLIEHASAQEVFSNYLYEPALAARDQDISTALQNIGVAFNRYHGSMLMAPETLQTGSGTPFKVFTPYWKKHQQLYSPKSPLNAPQHLKQSQNSLDSLPIERLQLLPNIHWYQGLQQHWQPGEQQALKSLNRFMQSALGGYKERRDNPFERYTSSLSPYLHFGEISPRQIYWHIKYHQDTPGQNQYASAETFIKEVVWREFAYYILHHFPQTADQPLDQRFRNFPYIKANKKLLHAWQTGTTGYPLVDAGMRELWHCGWMHNRVRMIAASFLTKNCLTSWKQGAQWFWDTLVDADLASNSFNWQWCAGCGADAVPYFRIFNPITQSQKFDPHGEYIKTWLPELRGLPEMYLHQPWKTPEDTQTQSNVIIGKHYPLPVIDLKQSRQRALDSYQQFVKSPSKK
jgi:deoxyribodipyrimidine photo-lyase